MDYRSVSAIFMVAAIGSGSNGRFVVDGTTSTASTAVATIQPRTGTPGYSWLRVYFYSSPRSADDHPGATKGRAGSVKKNWTAIIQLTVDKDSHVWQVDLSVPGHACTIAESDREANAALQEFQFDGKHLRLRGRGTHVCDMRLLHIPSQTFGWDVDVDVPVVEGAH